MPRSHLVSGSSACPYSGCSWRCSRGGFYHDGRFPTLATVVDRYNAALNLNLSSGEKTDLINSLLRLTFGESS
jgi:hypothetical protein